MHVHPFVGLCRTRAALLSDMQARLERQTDTNAGDTELESKLSTGPLVQLVRVQGPGCMRKRYIELSQVRASS